jgi:hypothetical protein
MPYDDPEETDPLLGVGVVLPAGPEATRELAYTFAEEFASMGRSEERCLRTTFFRRVATHESGVAWTPAGSSRLASLRERNDPREGNASTGYRASPTKRDLTEPQLMTRTSPSSTAVGADGSRAIRISADIAALRGRITRRR